MYTCVTKKFCSQYKLWLHIFCSQNNVNWLQQGNKIVVESHNGIIVTEATEN